MALSLIGKQFDFITQYLVFVQFNLNVIKINEHSRAKIITLRKYLKYY